MVLEAIGLAARPMNLSTAFDGDTEMWPTFFRDRAIIVINDESIGVQFTHWNRRRYSWLFKWDEIQSIKASMHEAACLEFRLIFESSHSGSAFVAEDMENWDSLEREIRKRFASFDWGKLTIARLYENRNGNFVCWQRETQDLGNIGHHLPDLAPQPQPATPTTHARG